MPKRGAGEALDLVQAEICRTDISDDKKMRRIYLQAAKYIVRNLEGLGPDRPPEKSCPCRLEPPCFPPPTVWHRAPKTWPLQPCPGVLRGRSLPEILTDPHGILFSALRRPHQHLPHRHPQHRHPLRGLAAPAMASSGLRPRLVESSLTGVFLRHDMV